jgi:hypothetical protein
MADDGADDYDDYDDDDEQEEENVAPQAVDAPPPPPTKIDFRCYPPVVNFHGIEPGVLYVLTISIQNFDSRVRRFAIKPPTSPNFVLNHIPSASISAGMELKAEIEFQMQEHCDYHDKITIISGKQILEVPLNAYIPAPDIQFNGFIDMGVIVYQNKNTAVLDFVNDGYAEGSFNITYDEALPIRVTPQQGKLEAKGSFVDKDQDGRMEEDEFVAKDKSLYSKQVKIEFTGENVGNFRELINVELTGQPDRVIDVSAEVMEQKLQLLLPDGVGPVSHIPFGCIHFGQTRNVTAMLMNNGPLPVSFNLSCGPLDSTDLEPQTEKKPKGEGDEFDDDDDDEEEEEPEAEKEKQPDIEYEYQDDDDEALVKPLAVRPEEGVIKPYSKVPLSIDFKPMFVEATKGFGASPPEQKTDINYGLKFVIESAETKQEIPIAVTGRAVLPMVQVSQKVFQFGECPANDRRDILLEIKNGGKLPMPFNINKLANFSCKPSKGLLQPGQSQKAAVSFIPGQMGKFKNVMHLVIDSGLQVIMLKVTGTSNSMQKKQLTKGGAAAAKEDFKPTFNFVRNEDAAKPPGKTFIRKQQWEDVEVPDGDDFITGNETHLTYSLTEQKARVEHKNKYNNLLRQQRATREKKQVDEVVRVKAGRMNRDLDPNGTDLGMETAYDALASPRLSAPKQTDPLWLARPMDGMEGARGGGANKRQWDENKLIRKKFKPLPLTQAEIRDCSQELEPEDLHMLSAGPKVFNFGTVNVNSTNAKSFGICNDLCTQFLCAVLTQEIPELSTSAPNSQVLPVGGTAGFDLIFTPKHEQTFERTVNYVINGHHTFKFTVSAEVIPITVDLSRNEIDFKFGEKNLDFAVTEVVTLTNPGNAIANFAWMVKGGSFGVSPESGALQPGTSLDVSLTYAPSFGSKNEEVLDLELDPGVANALKCIGHSDDAKCVFAEKKVDFGPVAIAHNYSKTVTLKSKGTTAAVFSVEPLARKYGITVEPMKGRINPGEKLELTVNFNPPTTRVYDDVTILVQVRSGRPAKLQFAATALSPECDVEQDEFNFESITIGASARQLLSVTNKSEIPASVLVDLSDYDDFSLELPEELMDSPAAGEEEVEAVMVPMVANEMFEAGKIRKIVERDPHAEVSDDDDEMEEEVYRKWLLRVKPNSTLSVYMMFSPTEVQSNSFELPMNIYGVKNNDTLKKVVAGKGLKPRLVLPKTVMDFGDRVVSRDLVKKIPYAMEVEFLNDDSDVMLWELDADKLAEPDVKATWQVSPKSAELSKGEKCIVRFMFLPSDDSHYSTVIPLYLDNNKDKPYLLLTLQGDGIYPHISFDRQECVLPIVPLHITSKCTFNVINTGYDNLELRYRLPIDTQRVPIQLKFPEGQTIGIAKEKLPIEVYFTGRAPMSFQAKIDFYDADDNKFTLPIIGTADNSLITNYPFALAHAEEFQLFVPRQPDEDEDLDAPQPPPKPLLLLSSQQIDDLRNGEAAKAKEANKSKKRRARSSKRKQAKQEEVREEVEKDVTPKGSSCHEKLPHVHDVEISLILRWCNANVFRQPVEVLPDDVVKANGRPVVDMIEASCGKTLPGKIKNKDLSTNARERCHQMTEFYTSMVTFLKSFGACLHNMLPIHLLDCEDYVRTREQVEAEKGKSVRLSPSAAMQRKHHFEREWGHLAREAWSNVIFQTIKVFVLARVTLKKFYELPGMAPPAAPQMNAAERRKAARGKGGKNDKKAGGPADIVGSNCYSVSESLLLKWLSYHVNQSTLSLDGPVRITNFDNDLKDGSALCVILAAHIPSLEDEAKGGPLAGFNRQVEDEEQASENRNKAVQAMEELGLGFGLSPDEIANVEPRVGLLLVLYLYQQLPQFMPKTTIEFSGALGVPILKSIELRNPSRKRITYDVGLEGSEDFRIHATSITMEGQGVASFPIELVARFSHAVEGRLTFRSRRENGVSGATMVFNLRSDIQSRQALRTITVECPTYQPLDVPLEIPNPFDKDCSFVIRMEQACIARPEVGGGKADNPFGAAPPTKKSGLPPRAPKEKEKKRPRHMMEFFCGKNQLKIRKGQTMTLPVHFLPFNEGTYRAQIIFLDEDAGEFLYEVIGKALLALPLEDLSFTADLEKGRVDKDLCVPTENAALKKAKHIAIDRLHGKGKAKAKEDAKKEDHKMREERLFKIEINSPFFSSQNSQLTVMDCMDEKGRRGDNGKSQLATPRGGGVGQNQFPICFQPHAAGSFPCKIILRPMATTGEAALDLRVYQMNVKVTSPGVKTVLEFIAPARQSITQEIPITNNTDADWTLGAALTGGNKIFKGPGNLKVPAGETKNYVLSFSPSWICELTAKLVLNNSATGEKYDYELQGVGEEPLAEDNVVIKCQARDKIAQELTVRNNKKKSMIFSVESDLPHVSGASSIEVPAGGEAKYVINICPQLGGEYTGSITFMEPEGEFVWYTIEVQASSPEPEQTLEISAAVRRAVQVEISLANPLNERVEFEIELVGAGLLGAETFTMEPMASDTYELLYSPLLPGTQMGSVSFTNDKLGEFWYELKLSAEPAPPTELPPMSAEVGRSMKQTVILENPTGMAVQLISNVDNRRNFSVSPGQLQLPPYGQAEATVEYTPSALSTPQNALISYSHAKLGEWLYEVSGTGSLPTTMDTVEVPVPIGQTQSQSFAFRNPFATAVAIQVNLTAETQEILSLFKLLLKRPNATVPAFGTLQIPLSFSPSVIAERVAVVEITTTSVAVPGKPAGTPLNWIFPIQGIAEAPPFEAAFNYKCQSRKHLQELLEVQLEGLEIDSGADESFTHQLIVPEDVASFVERSFFLEPQVDTISDPATPLSFNMLFEPLRPFSTTVELVIEKSSGGRWRYEIQLEASEPDIDDIIKIESPLNRTSSVSFKIHNQFMTHAPFTAEFTSSSSLAFTVSPSSGNLEPYGKDGQELVISYTPTEYGKMQQGTLTIITEDFQWTYDVQGTHIEYNVPAATAKVSSKLEGHLERELRAAKKAPKNIMRNNMKGEALKLGPGRGLNNRPTGGR